MAVCVSGVSPAGSFRVPSFMAFEPSAEELASFTDVDAIAVWLELDGNTLEAIAEAAGARTRSLRTWARIPAARLTALLASTAVDDGTGTTRGLTPVEEGQAGDLRDILLKWAQGGPSTATAAAQGGQGGRDGAGNITEQAAAGAAGAPAAVAPEDAAQGHPGTALP